MHLYINNEPSGAPSRDGEEREAKEQLATVDGGGDEIGGFQLATVGETITRQRKMERLP